MSQTIRYKDHGFAGIYYPGKKALHCAIISAGGATGSAFGAKMQAGTFIKAGYNVLVVAQFGWKDMPNKALYDVKVEYVQRAIQWLKDRGITRFAMSGISTGAGYTLLCASLIPEISAAVAVSPFDYVMQSAMQPKGQTWEMYDRSVYSYLGKDLPFAYFAYQSDELDRAKEDCLSSPGYGQGRLCRFVYDTAEINPQSRIKIENSHADLLLLASDNDDMWPSEKCVERIREELSDYPHKVKIKIYPHGSHVLGITFSGLLRPVILLMIKKIIPAEGKHPAECEAARADSSHRMLAFIERWSKKK